MRLTKERIEQISETIATSLIEENFIILVGLKQKKFQESISQVIRDELAIEDNLNEEVRNIMESYTDEINRGNVDYGRMFQMIKKKLIRKKGIIL